MLSPCFTHNNASCSGEMKNQHTCFARCQSFKRQNVLGGLCDGLYVSVHLVICIYAHTLQECAKGKKCAFQDWQDEYVTVRLVINNIMTPVGWEVRKQISY